MNAIPGGAGLARALYGADSEPPPTWVLCTQLLTLVAAGVYVAFAVMRSSSAIQLLADVVFYHLILAVAGLLILVRAYRRPSERAAWVWIGGAVLLWNAGDAYWMVANWRGVDVPGPSLGDAAWLAVLPCLYVGLALLLHRRLKGLRASVWLDGLVAMLATAALGSALLIPVLGGSPDMAVATNLLYPLGDLVLLSALIGGFVILGSTGGRGLGFLAAGLLVFGVGDATFVWRAASDAAVAMNVFDSFWLVGLVVLSLAAWQPPRERPLEAVGRPTALALPAIFSLSAFGLLVWDHFQVIPTLAVWLAAATFLVASARTALTFKEVATLADTRRQARTDDLTGLGNRRLMRERLRDLMGGRLPGERLALLLVDLDRFKEINDALGHHLGDEMLRQVGPRLLEALREGDEVARLGGDEFAILLAPDVDPRIAERVAGRIREAIQRPFVVDGVTLHIDASIGIAICPDHADSPDELLQRADVAMYQAKRESSVPAMYDERRDVHSRARLQRIADLRSGLADDQLVVHYQPKVDVATGRVRGAEALVRWDHPTEGMLYPDAFLPLVERTGLMRDLTLHVLDAALHQCAAWQALGWHLEIAVNLSVSSLMDGRLLEDVAHHLGASGLRPDLLVLEVTEDLLMSDPVKSRQVIESLRNMGVRVSVDDYGTGYSSMSYLRQLTLDELKLDKSFVMELGQQPELSPIVRSTVHMAHALGLELVAEGVEDEAGWQLLREFGCDIAQGYFISRPLPASMFLMWLRTQPAVGRLPRP